MNSFEQLDENLDVANNTPPMSMSFEDLETVEYVKRVMRDSLKINCSTCGYCMPCPQGVNIPECMKIYNEKYLFNHKGFINPSFMDYYQYVGGIMGNSGNAGVLFFRRSESRARYARCMEGQSRLGGSHDYFRVHFQGVCDRFL